MYANIEQLGIQFLTKIAHSVNIKIICLLNCQSYIWRFIGLRPI